MPKYKSKARDYQLIVKAKLSFKEKVNERELDFFSAKHVSSLFSATMKKKRLIEYSGRVGIGLYDFLKKPITRRDFYMIIEHVVEMEQQVKANALSIDKVVDDLHYIYINEQTKELQFLYLPLEGMNKSCNLLQLIENIVYSVKPVQEQDSDYLSKFILFIRSLQSSDMKQVENYILKEDRDVVNSIKKPGTDKKDRTSGSDYKYRDKYFDAKDGDDTGLLDESTGLLDEGPTGFLNEEDSDDEATGFLQDEEQTGLLREEGRKRSYPKLYRVLTDETIVIDKPVFRIGKERSYTDYFVSNNGAVSRNHCDIIVRGNRYFVMDLNSKNRTFINDKVISVRVETEIFDGDRLKLANEEFVFYAA